jgi:hypothetical protein
MTGDKAGDKTGNKKDSKKRGKKGMPSRDFINIHLL